MSNFTNDDIGKTLVLNSGSLDSKPVLTEGILLFVGKTHYFVQIDKDELSWNKKYDIHVKHFPAGFPLNKIYLNQDKHRFVLTDPLIWKRPEVGDYYLTKHGIVRQRIEDVYVTNTYYNGYRFIVLPMITKYRTNIFANKSEDIKFVCIGEYPLIEKGDSVSIDTKEIVKTWIEKLPNTLFDHATVSKETLIAELK